MIETRHGLDPFFVLLPSLPLCGRKKDVGTGLDSRPCLVSIIFADLPSLHTLHFIEMIFILVPPNFC